jgi:drug/metabolite transporter (DMT)-like permease
VSLNDNKVTRFWRDLNPNVRGAALVGTGALFLTLMVVCAKFLGSRLDSLQITFVRSFVGLLFVLPLALKHGRNIYRTKVPLRHFQRGGIGILGNTCLFYSVTHLVLADAMALQFSRPLWGVVLALIILKESVGWRRGLATVIGFGGILLMTRPFDSGFDPNSIVGALGAVFAALVIVSIKQLARSEGTMVIMFYYAFWGAVLSFPPAAYVWQWPSWSDWAVLVAVGFVGIVGQTLVTMGVRQAETSVVLPFDYLRIVYAFFIGLWLFDEVPNAYSAAGTLIIVASTLYILIREARAKTDAKTAAG